MVTGALMHFFYVLVHGAVGLLPEWHVQIPDYGDALPLLGQINYLVPIGVVFAACFATLALTPAFLSWKLFVILFGALPGGQKLPGAE